MGYLALYRRYRPQSFDTLVGQDHIVKTLTNQIMMERLGHAYLFTGTRGTGKTSAAKIFAKAINCLNPENGSPCGKCEVCTKLGDSSNIDVLEIDAASNNGVNEIRELREKVQYKPVSCKYKVYIIDEVHMLTGPAFNALLKTLEEPPSHVVFILATTEVHKIPATILSRCMRFDFRLIPTEQIAELIAKIYSEQGKEFDKEAVYAIAKAGEGSIRDALSIADIALSYNEGILTYNDVLEVLGASGYEYTVKLLKSILESKAGEVLESIEELSTMGKGMGVLIKDVCAMVRDLLIVKTCTEANSILMLPQNRFLEYVNLAKITSEERLLRILEIFAQAEASLKYSNHPRVVFETASIKATKPETDYNLDTLIARIKELENKISNVKSISVQNKSLDTIKDEPKKEVAKQKTFLKDCSESDLKGMLLVGLRNIGSEMLWNVMQGIKLEISGNNLILTTETDGDYLLLDKKETIERIKEALSNLEEFDVVVKLSEKGKSLDEVDQATERIKKIFGDDIVIIK